MSMPPRCSSCSSTFCCVTWQPLLPLEVEELEDVQEELGIWLDPESILYWTRSGDYQSATRARARVARTRGNDS